LLFWIMGGAYVLFGMMGFFFRGTQAKKFEKKAA